MTWRRSGNWEGPNYQAFKQDLSLEHSAGERKGPRNLPQPPRNQHECAKS